MSTSASQPVLFSLLPKSRTPWSEFFLSYGTQALILVVLAWIPVLHPEIIDPPTHDYKTIAIVPSPPPVNHAPQKQLPPRPMPVVAKVEPTPVVEAMHLPAPQPKPRVQPQEDVKAPQVMMAANKLEPIPTAQPALPKKLVALNTFSTGSSAPQTIRSTPDKVQTGGFGDPNGVPAKLNTGKAPVNIAQAGGFDMPTGPGVGNGTGGAKGRSGVVASTGFGNGVAVTATSAATARAVVKEAGFNSDVAAPTTVGSRATAPVAAKTIPAEILSKPVPIYTEEARRMRIEGEVLVEAVLGASGKVQVLRVVRGLGHGLDEEAVRRAEQIHFKPASRDGQPADSTVVLHIIFQLA